MNKTTQEHTCILVIFLIIFGWWMTVTFFGHELSHWIDDTLPGKPQAGHTHRH